MVEKRAVGDESMAGSGWREASRVLRERAQVAFAVSMAVEQVLVGDSSAGDDNPFEKLQEIVNRVVQTRSQTPVGSAVRRGPIATRGGRRAEADSGMHAEMAWQQMHATDLSGKVWPVVWFATESAGAESATLALGVQADGCKRVLGVWSGAASEHRCGQRIAADLQGRGLGRGSVWLAVTGGERALDLALRQHWGEKVGVAACQRRTAREVMAHLPVAARQPAERALQAAWDEPAPNSARAQLEALADGWQRAYPGAAARLRSAIGGTTVVQGLGLNGALAQRLRTAVPAAYLLMECLPAARGRTGRAWIAALAAEALRRQAGFRRLSEHACLETLERALAEQVAPGRLSAAAGR